MPTTSDRPEPARPSRRRLAARIAAIAALVLAVLAPLPALADGDGRVVDHETRMADGGTVTVDLLAGAKNVKPGSARLLLDVMPAGTTLTADGRRLKIPDEGTWQIAPDGRHATFTPVASRFGREPTLVRYAATSSDGSSTPPGLLSVVMPLLPDMVRSAPFGDKVLFDLREVQVGVDPSTLRLAPSEGETIAKVSDDGTEITIPDQGVWRLDRARQQVVFTPESKDVRIADPVVVRGTDESGAKASPGRLRIGYPLMADESTADRPGASVQFSPMDDTRNIQADSLALTDAGMPKGTVLGEQGQRMDVPGQGTWTIDSAARTVTFTPTGVVSDSPTPVVVSASGLYADNPARAVLRLEVTATPPTARSDHLRTAPSRRVSADLLANDTPGRAHIPFDPSTIYLQSFDAVNLAKNPRGTGTTLVIPDQGTFQVRKDGVLVFSPAPGFEGRTTPVRYFVTDTAGVTVSETIQVDVDPDAPVSTGRTDTAGINTLLAGITPQEPATASVFLTISALLLFAGGSAAWIGSRMDTSSEAAYRARARRTDRE